ncbi:MAG TPA: thioredoxin family protein [Terriglobales bacterium]|nr:thioredoxin family protein [Terriglobales bacterium]
MPKIKICVAFLLLIGCSGVVAQRLPDADQVLAQVNAQASEQDKNVLLVFGASWCRYCKQFEKFLAAPEIQPIIAKHFVVARLEVYEELGRNPKLNNPKSDTLVRKFGDADVGGLPFIVFLDPKGGLIVNSNRPSKGKRTGENIGYPSAPEEIDWFMVMIKRAAPELTENDAAIVEAWLRKAAS